jgi:hypothetical protein
VALLLAFVAFAVYDLSLDAEQTTGSDDPQPFLELLRHRFAGSRPDVVVTIGPPAAAFYLQNRDKIFPETPLVIAGLDERLARKSALRAGDAVVAIHQNLSGLIDASTGCRSSGTFCCVVRTAGYGRRRHERGAALASLVEGADPPAGRKARYPKHSRRGHNRYCVGAHS